MEREIGEESLLEIQDTCDKCCRISEDRNSSNMVKYQTYGNKEAVNMCSIRQRTCRVMNTRTILHDVFQHKPLWICLITLFLVLSYSENSYGFNMDVENSIRFDVPETGTYFGYSVAMLKRSSSTKWLLFGAPRANSRYLPTATRPGAIHKCELRQDPFAGHICDEIQIDDKDTDFGNDDAGFNGTTRIFVHGRDNQWLGASIDVHEDKGIVTCASRWFNKYFLKDGYYFMNGLCYEVPLDFSPANIRKIPALVDGTKQTMVVGNSNVTKLNYGMAGLGASVHYANQGNDLLMGAPGLRTWTGGFIGMSQTRNYMTEYDQPPTEISEMAGYAMTSGDYFGNGQTYFAIGGPRDKLTGKVYLFEGERKHFIMEEAYLTLDGSELNGLSTIPVNGFFGAALWSVDVNNDRRVDLIVGVPMYSEMLGLLDETGLAMVYLGQEDFRFKLMKEPLRGSGGQGARFGSAISSLGDINSDNYNDIVIGAPYEDDLQGAIYIYNGCKTGIWPRYSQRIAAATVGKGSMGFGISFSKPQDMNDDGVNDIAVGAYLSDRAYLMFGKSVISVDITIRPSIAQLDQHSNDRCTYGGSQYPCFSVDVCCFYTRRTLPVLDLKITITLDTYMGEYNRIAWQDGGLSTMSTNLKAFHNDRSCIGHRKVFIKSTADLVTPVRILAGYSVISFNSGASLLPEVNHFNGDMPEKNLLVATSILQFKKDCPYTICRTILNVAANAVYQKHQEYFIVGTSNLDLHVTITKIGDPSYGSNVFLAFPKSLMFQKVEKVYGDTEVSCGFIELDEDASDAGPEEDTNSLEYLQRQLVPKKSKDELMLACSFGNPMYNNTGVKFVLKMIVPESVTETKLQFRLNATTLSTVVSSSDNTKTLDIVLRNKVTTIFNGVSRPSYQTIRDKAATYEFSHIYELRNQGPSPLPAADIMVEYPQVQKKGAIQLRLNSTEWSCRYPCNITCKFPDVDNTAPVVFAAGVGPSYSTNTEDNIGEAKAYTELRNTNCETQACSRYECKLRDIPPRESAVVTLNYVVTGDILDTISDGQRMALRSEANVLFGETDRLISTVERHFTHILTDLLPVTPPKQPLPWWIILVSVLGGILLIVIVVLILWKCGFFKRKTMEEMKAMQHSGEVEKMLPDDADAAQVPDEKA